MRFYRFVGQQEGGLVTVLIPADIKIQVLNQIRTEEK